MLSILNLTKTNKLVLAAFAFLAVLAFGSGRAHAATLNISGGCTLPIAINSVNAGANQSGCTATGSYGSDDTITIPAGVTDVTSILPNITEPVTVKGAGMAQTTVRGDARVSSIFIANDTDVTFSDMKFTRFAGTTLYGVNSSFTIRNIEIDGADSIPYSGDLEPITISNHSSDTKTVDVENVYIHNIDVAVTALSVLFIGNDGGGTINVNLDSVTTADIHNSGTGNIVQGINLYVSRDGGAIDATIANTTVDDITGDDLVVPFASWGLVDEGAGTAEITTHVQNITITGVRGATGTGSYATVKSAAFYAASLAEQTGDEATVTVDVTNSLIADNLNDGLPSNCIAVDFTGFSPSFLGTGTAVINSLGYNMSDDDSCTGFTQTGDQQNVNNIIPTLGSLKNNGGAVPTRALLPGSPAIAAGGAVLGVATDARGIARPNSSPSIGAYQYVLADDTTGPTIATAPNTGVGSVTQLLNVLASMLGIGLLAYVFRKQQRSS